MEQISGPLINVDNEFIDSWKSLKLQHIYQGTGRCTSILFDDQLSIQSPIESIPRRVHRHLQSPRGKMDQISLKINDHQTELRSSLANLLQVC